MKNKIDAGDLEVRGVVSTDLDELIQEYTHWMTTESFQFKVNFLAHNGWKFREILEALGVE